MLFLLVWGGVKVCAQADNLSLTPLYDAEVNNGVVQFKNTNLSSSCLGGASWATTFNTGEIHIFTVTIAESSSINTTTTLCLTASTTEVGKYGSPTIVGETSTIEVSSTEDGTKQLVLRVESNYGAVYLWQSAGEGNGWGKVKIASITREVVTASSVAAPTISPASSTYDGDLSVTITKGAGNEKVVYSVSGATTGNEIDAEFTADSKTLTLTGTGIITVTAKGVVGSEESSKVTRTYTYDSDIPSGKTSIASDNYNHTLPCTFNSADDVIEFNSSRFNNENIAIGNYVVLDIDVTNDNTWFCFKKGYGDSPFNQCTSIYSGNSANDCWVNKNDKYWWMKISDQKAVGAFIGSNVQIKGSKIKDTDNYSAMTVNSFSIYKSKAISESVDNTIESKINHVVVELRRSFVAGTWNTVCLPFSLTPAQATQLFGPGYQLTQFTSVSGTTMQFTTTNSFVAGVPYLVKPTIDVSNASPVVLVDVNITAKNPTPVTFGNYTFTGTFTTKTFTSADNTTSRFVATGNELVTPNENSTLKSLRCYFTVPAAATARSLTFDIDEEGGTTSINTVQGSGVMVNGYYNLNGQRVAQPTKGLYIVNGKKVVIK